MPTWSFSSTFPLLHSVRHHFTLLITLFYHPSHQFAHYVVVRSCFSLIAGVFLSASAIVSLHVTVASSLLLVIRNVEFMGDAFVRTSNIGFDEA
ncbi:hypothetical protein Y032_0013g1922 [Ancylostoma ceylanicum]|uniref:Uncharacterized protein n=1 Tax=Ancylostoma ceylanicum TaxID=53326 RepID=A0A016V9X7_9BILA|nr:hypothetical protein Y032_0013g1922 [Ancylostoma ceylanicum]